MLTGILIGLVLGFVAGKLDALRKLRSFTRWLTPQQEKDFRMLVQSSREAKEGYETRDALPH